MNTKEFLRKTLDVFIGTMLIVVTLVIFTAVLFPFFVSAPNDAMRKVQIFCANRSWSGAPVNTVIQAIPYKVIAEKGSRNNTVIVRATQQMKEQGLYILEAVTHESLSVGQTVVVGVLGSPVEFCIAYAVDVDTLKGLALTNKAIEK